MKSYKTLRGSNLPILLIPTLVTGLMLGQANAATLVVTNTADPGIGGCTALGSGDGCTLREAIIAANNQTLTPGDDTINATGISGVITLATALPRLSTNIILNGPGAANLTVQRSGAAGTPNFRVFTIDNTTTSGPIVSLSGLTIAGGKVSGSTSPTNCGGGIYNNHGTLALANSVLKNNAATNGGALCNDGSLSVNATLALSNTTITNNTATSGGGGIFNNGSQGGSTPLTINHCVLTNNQAVNGGAILNDGRSGGSATITELSNSVLRANTASGNGGGIENNGTTGGSATLVISYSALSSNSAINGGGINNNGTGGSATQAVSYSTLNANTASANGGAINNDGRSAGSATVTAGTSTFSANTATRGGAIDNIGTGGSATVEIDNSTLVANQASVNSAAISSDGTGGSATLALGSTILANGPSANLRLTVNSETTFTSKNHNLCSDAAGGDGTSSPGGLYLNAGGDIRNTDPKLDPAGLQDNGGPTNTIALEASSPAIDQGLSNVPTDQRGAPRPYDNPAIVNASGGNGSDIGAYELTSVTLSVNNPRSLPEGSAASPGSVTFDVTLSSPSTQSVTVNYQTTNGINNPATAGSDYVAKSGKLTFAPGETLKRVTINFIGDSVPELNETFFFDLDTSTFATIFDSRGVGTIVNDDGPDLNIEDAAIINEGNSGTTPQTFVVRLSQSSTKTITVDWATMNDSAGLGDYVPASGTLTFAPGQTSKLITVLVNGDTKAEPDETYKVILSKPTYAVITNSQGIGTIRNDDATLQLFESDEPSL